MKETVIYLLEVLASSGILLAAYTLLLERRTAFALCRRYLIAMPLLAAGIPLLRIPVWSSPTVSGPAIVLGDITAEAVAAPVRQPLHAPDQFVLLIYGAGVALILGSLLRQYRTVRRLERGAAVEFRGGIRFVRTRRPMAAFSFCRTIYLPEGLSDAEQSAIVAHERSHIRHRHSAERLVMELFKALLWWNPFVWIASHRLVEAQEFEADRDVVEQGCDLAQYMGILFEQQFGRTPEIANGLRSSLTKKRFIMMTRKGKSRHARLRAAAALPIVAALVVAFGFTAKEAVPRSAEPPAGTEQPGRSVTISGQVVQAPENRPVAGAKIIAGESMTAIAARSEHVDARSNAEGRFTLQGPAEGYLVVSNSEGTSAAARAYRCEPTEDNLAVVVRLEKPSSGKQTDEETPYLSVETMPRFEGGDPADFHAWVQAQIRYPEEAMKRGLQGRVVAQFIIERDGTVDEITILQTPDASLSDEARRVLEKSPKWSPGLQKGEPVRVKFAFPIDFRLGEKNAPTAPIPPAKQVPSRS